MSSKTSGAGRESEYIHIIAPIIHAVWKICITNSDLKCGLQQNSLTSKEKSL